MIDGPNFGALATPLRDPRLQCTHVQLVQGNIAYCRHDPFQATDVVAQASLVLVLKHKLRRGLLEGSRGPYAVDVSLTGLFHHSREMRFRCFELSCTSALANSPPEQALVDMPVSGPHDEAGDVFASHVLSPFRAGRPLRDL